MHEFHSQTVDAISTRHGKSHAGQKPPQASLVEIQLPRSRACAALARGAVEQHVGGLTAGQVIDELKLVVTELVDNAFLHGRGEILLKLVPRRDAVRVEVIDEGEGAAVRIREQSPENLGGFGLRLVAGLSRTWGANEGTTHVWAEVPLH